MQPTSSTTPRRRLATLTTFVVFAAGSLALGACGRHAAYATSSQSEAAHTDAPPLALAPPTPALPPLPVPATFDVAALADQIKPLVVNITTTHEVEARGGMGMDQFDDLFGQHHRMPQPETRQRQMALGTGFIIDPNGYVVTNNHVIDGADDVRVRLADDREFNADVVGRDPKLDIALLHMKGATGLPASSLGSSDQLRVGESVLAVGNPYGLGHTVTLGIVSAKARTIGAGPYDDFIQTDASINPGNSGGPLFNWRGQVVGINTAIRAGANGIGFAIPIDAVKDVLPQLRATGHVERGKLGLAFQPLTPDLAKAFHLESQHGALVADVEPGGSAARAGIKSGDVILAVNGVAIGHAEELPRNVARNAPGKAITLSIERGGAKRDVQATLDALVDEEDTSAPQHAVQADKQAANKLGIQVSDAPGGGVRVDGILEGSVVRDIAPGDIIIDVDGAPISNVESLRAAMAKLKPGSEAVVKVRRNKMTVFAAIPIPAK